MAVGAIVGAGVAEAVGAGVAEAVGTTVGVADGDGAVDARALGVDVGVARADGDATGAPVGSGLATGGSEPPEPAPLHATNVRVTANVAHLKATGTLIVVRSASVRFLV